LSQASNKKEAKNALFIDPELIFVSASERGSGSMAARRWGKTSQQRAESKKQLPLF